jgi:hypothetical protein
MTSLAALLPSARRRQADNALGAALVARVQPDVRADVPNNWVRWTGHLDDATVRIVPAG